MDFYSAPDKLRGKEMSGEGRDNNQFESIKWKEWMLLSFVSFYVIRNISNLIRIYSHQTGIMVISFLLFKLKSFTGNYDTHNFQAHRISTFWMHHSRESVPLFRVQLHDRAKNSNSFDSRPMNDASNSIYFSLYLFNFRCVHIFQRIDIFCTWHFQRNLLFSLIESECF